MNVCINHKSQLDNIDVSEEIDVNKTTDSGEINVRFQPKVYDGCHDLT